MTYSGLEVIFARNPGTTGYHLLRAAETKGLTPGGSRGAGGGQWRLWVESFGAQLVLPSAEQVLEGKLAAWMIDSHVNVGWQCRIAPAFAHVFCAQRSAVSKIRSVGVQSSWLPLAAPDDLFEKGPLLQDRRFDLAFVGAALPGSPRERLLSVLRREFSFVPTPQGFVPPAEMMEVYRQAKMVINLPIGRDLNMRVFEAIAAGSLLATSPCDGLDVIFPEGAPVVVPDQEPENWIPYVRRALEAPDAQTRADTLHEAVRGGHTYGHRIDQIEAVLATTKPSQVHDGERLRALVSGFVHYGQPGNVWTTPGISGPPRLAATAAAAGVAAARFAFSRASQPVPGLSRAVQRTRCGG